MSISPDLWFHLQGIEDLYEYQNKIEAMFGIHNLFQSYQIENQLITLSPNDFPCI